jgi:hypothetical protein
MRQIFKAVFMIGAAVGLLLCRGQLASAEPVDGPWENADTFGSGPFSTTTSNTFVVGEEPNDPTINSNFAEQEMIFSPFSLMTLTNPGDKVVFTGSVTLNGTINSPSSGGSPRTQFRFGLFKDNGNTAELGWVGYFMHNKHGDLGGTPLGALGVKPVGNTSAFLSTVGGTTLQSQGGDGTAASLFNDGTYNLTMSIERNGAGELVLNSSIVGVGDRPPVETYPDPENPPPSPGPNLFSQIMGATHTLASTLGTYEFDRLGFLLGGNLDADRAAFADLDVTFTPGGAAGQPGDLNGDGLVDAADYVAYRKGGPIVNDTAPPGVGPEDYDAFFENFGEGGPGGGQSPVPEPATAILIGLATLCVTLSRRALPR